MIRFKRSSDLFEDKKCSSKMTKKSKLTLNSNYKARIPQMHMRNRD